MKARLAAPAAALLLAGCISFGPKVPDTLLSLTSEAPPAPGAGTSGTLASAIVVLEPEAGQRLDVQRVPVQVDAANVAYLKNAMWVERPARLLQRLIAETIRGRDGRLVLDADPAADTAIRLSGRLLEMGYDARTASAVVRFDAVRERPDGRIDTRRFESIVAGVQAEAGPVGAALNRAANDVARQVADWVG
jgi:cholesterol transport system auxiliary component